MSEISQTRLKWLALAYAATLVILVVVAGRGQLAVRWLLHLPYGDKIGHFVLMGIMSFLVNAALGDARLRWRGLAARKGSVLVGAVVLFEEVSQLWLEYRAFELADLAADFAGIWVFAELAAHVVARSERNATPAQRRPAG